MTNPEQIPPWLAKGITYHKTSEKKSPKNYRSITCLSAGYNLLISIITEHTHIYFWKDKQTNQTNSKDVKKYHTDVKTFFFINRMIFENRLIQPKIP